MFSPAKTKLIIVCDEKTKEYANFLRQLISANDDSEGNIVGVADGSVEVAVWLDKEYLQNSPTISSNEHILFIGDNKVSKSEVSSMITRFERYGMKFGWLGKRGMMQVDNKLLNEEQYNSFIDYCMDYKEQLPLQRLEYKQSKRILEKTDVVDDGQGNKAIVVGAKVIAGAARGMFPFPIYEVGAYAASKGLSVMSMRKKIKDQQYRALTVIFYIAGLKKFLEG